MSLGEGGGGGGEGYYYIRSLFQQVFQLNIFRFDHKWRASCLWYLLFVFNTTLTHVNIHRH